ncbi:right-handed parallel beta-helix repeat-containing protein [Hymenobacter weizhouensis]|uniref:right-handed parallel beta-helix repeat-containing protein n=1 Tax=Hymenobacter sp. YIM 151500-1 TaxID=2987689 RepID=UPI0022276E89|nr:right-handed parallel beta-helix repeat-containing protein [Hymenobacter sp. YIM 151500-1]UYZ64942.1 right-handed parallel beta-helix repeat-containing protein [Hymenobacter sp. YIM 151500-1]
MSYRIVSVLAVAFLSLWVLPSGLQAQAPADVDDFVTIPASTGIVTIKDTSYALPTSGPVRYYSPAGSNDNDGLTPATAWRTLTNAQVNSTALVPTGATLVFATGTYPVDEVGIRRRLTLQPAPGAKAWLTGSIPVTNWVADNGDWRADNWTATFPNDADPRTRDAAFPASHLQDMVFVNNLGLKQVLTRAEVRVATATSPATFYVDYATKQLYIGANPAGNRVEAAAYHFGIKVVSDAAAGTRIRGLGFRGYGGDSALQGWTTGYTIENCTFAWNALAGMVIGNTPTNVRVRGNTFTDNGHQGLSVGGPDASAANFVIERNTFRFNNNEHFRRNWAAAGLKLHHLDDVMVRNNLFEFNNCMGLWLDLDVERVQVLANVAHHNSAVGIFFEVSRGALLAGNVAYGNSDGVYISGSSNVQIYNNTLVGNLRNLRIKDTSRENDEKDAAVRAAQVARGLDYNTYDIDAWNNVLADGRAVNASVLNGWTTCRTKPMVRTLDHNLYVRSSTQTPAVPTLVQWNQRGSSCDSDASFTSLASFTGQTNFERNGRQLDGQSLSNLFEDWNSGNFQFRLSACQLPPARQNVPIAVRTALGLLATAPVWVGAFQGGAACVSQPTAAQPAALASAVAVYPNPATEQVTLAWIAAATEPARITVLTAHGQPVTQLARTLKLRDSSLTLNLSSLAAGVYFLHVERGPERLVQRVVVLK